MNLKKIYNNSSESNCKNLNVETNKNEQIKFFVINFASSTARLEKVTKQLIDANVKFEAYNAINGYNVILHNLQTNEIFAGQDMKNKHAKIENAVLYNITCNPYDQNPTSFKYLGSYYQGSKKTASAGEIGLWCSNLLLWKHVAERNYERVIICEDDIKIKNIRV